MAVPGRATRRRIVALLALYLAAAAGLTGRIAYWQLVRGEELSRKGEAIRRTESRIRAHRGPIVDRNGQPLAVTVTAEAIWANPRDVEDKEGTAAILAAILQRDVSDILQLLQKKTFHVYIARRPTEAQVAQVRAYKARGQLKGIELEPGARRVYPEGDLAAHILGFAGIDNQGLEGLELRYDEQLRGQDGAVLYEKDARGYQIPEAPRTIEPPVPGLTLVLTIDKSLQLVVEQALDRTLDLTQARRAAIMVMETATGGLLAVAARPAFDPNAGGNSDPALRRMWLVADQLSPGSVFKPVTMAAYLEEGLGTPDTPFSDPGCFLVLGEQICNWNHQGFHGTLTDVMRNSSNVGFATLGIRLGRDRFYKWLDRFNLTRPTGIDLPGEARGAQVPKERATDLDLAVQAFGQTLTVTPVQMLAAVNAIANDGCWVQPHLAREFRTPDGEVAFRPQPVRRCILSPETARQVQRMMTEVVRAGTGRSAAVPGHEVAGKTGTAEKFEGGRKVEGKYIASFLGFAPVPNPRVTVLIMIDEPQGLTYGGQVAAPVFSQIIGDILRYLEVPPTAGPGESGALSGSGAGRAQDPGTPAGAAPATVGVRVPDLRGRTLREAADLLAGLGLSLELTPGGSGVVMRQEPGPGVTVAPGGRVRVWLGSSGGPVSG
ncbi:MAG: PASTA domain-containing protein [Firmicutes bacterium]|nr:PASTA domain-containing protein [Bacillota bacterium]